METALTVRATLLWILVTSGVASAVLGSRGVAPGALDTSDSGKTMPHVAIVDLDGETLSAFGSEDKLTLVNFWATWCRPCRVEIPDLIALQDDLGEKLRIIGLAVEDVETPALRAFVAENGINYRVARSTPDIEKLVGVSSVIPTTYLIDRRGRLGGVIVGRIDAAVVRGWVRTVDEPPLAQGNHPMGRITQRPG